MKANLRVLAGLGEKKPACFLLEIEGARILMDAGEGPDIGKIPSLEPLKDLKRLDGILLSHAHPDHAGALERVRSALGSSARRIPVFGTYSTLKTLNIWKGIELPDRGSAAILGIPLITGRAGHAPGGIWIHFDIGKGLLYMGDSCPSSEIFAYDPPPPSRFVLFDASYELYDGAARFEEPFWKDALNPNRLEFGGGLVLPVPADGRGVEFVYLLAKTEGIRPDFVQVDSMVRDAVLRCVREDFQYLKDGVVRDLERVAEGVRDSSLRNLYGLHLVSNGEATAGKAAEWVMAYESEKYPSFIFTGYLGKGTPARRLVESGRALWRRWNVHPTLSETITLLQSTGAEEGVPCFTEHPEMFRSVGSLVHLTFHCGKNQEILIH